MAYTGHLIDVETSVEYDDLNANFGNLVWLAGIGNTFRGDLGDGNVENSPRASPALSPNSARPENIKLAELTRPLDVRMPEPIPAAELAACRAYVEQYRAREEFEKLYISFVFQEYKKRKSIEAKYTAAWDAIYAELDTARQRELTPEARLALSVIEADEEAARTQLRDTYGKFVTWVDETVPQWLDAVREKETARTHQEAAKKAAMEAAKAALTAELMAGKKLADPGVGPSGGAGMTNATRNPYDASEYGVDIDIDASPETPAVSESALRQKAIKMLEQEEAVVKQRRAQHLEQLRAEEDALRRRLEEKEKQQQSIAQNEHAQDLQTRCDALREQEKAIQSRLDARSQEEQQKEAERTMMLEHIAAEEQLLRRRLDEKEAKRKAAEEEEKRMLYEHLQAEEALLRERVQKREAAAAEAKRQEEAVRLMQRQQEEAMQRAKEDARRQQEEQHRRETEAQLSYLQSKEDAYKSRLRAKELAEIEASEQLRQRQVQKDLQQLYQLAPPQPYAPAAYQPQQPQLAMSMTTPSSWGTPSPVPASIDPSRFAYPAPSAQPAMVPSYAAPQFAANYTVPMMPGCYGGPGAATVPAMQMPGAPFTPPNAGYPPAVAYQPSVPIQGYYYRS